MSPPVSVRRYGRHAILIELPDQAAVHRAWGRLMAARRQGLELLAGVEEVVAGARTILVVRGPDASPDPASCPDPVSWSDRLGQWMVDSLATGPDHEPGAAGRDIEIPVVYDGPDLEEVGRLTGLSVADVASRHAGAVWTVGFLGFGPGFAYLGGGDPALAVPRRSDPRPAVPAGAVGLAAGMSAVYPAEMPGGWQLIGRTEAVLFDPARDPPALLAPGDRVRFRRVEVLSEPTRPHPSEATPMAGVGGTSGVVEVLRPGPGSTVQDLGRVGHAHEGVPRAGAADSASLQAANAQVGNPAGAAGLETTVAGPTLRFRTGGLVGVAGADAPVTLDGAAVTAFPVRVPPGSVLAVGAARRGVRSYVAIAGGVALTPVLGSRATDTLSRLGPAPLRAGDILPIGAVGADDPVPSAPSHRVAVPTPLPDGTGPVILRAVPGPRADRLARGELDRLFSVDMAVSPVSDRVGVRTEGLELNLRSRQELPSEGVVAGAVQVPPGGRPIVLLANHGTTGGYPVVAVVEDGDLAVLAQTRPGSRIRLVRAAGPDF
ncbi:MAG TPA: 5-oxoprolinase/urea amidolyase family protein [Acidimicrobiales bacterium]|nr:5-oxoprolinase/urea amidolyase family protein [Acidimicrobiales bacterium]